MDNKERGAGERQATQAQSIYYGSSIYNRYFSGTIQSCVSIRSICGTTDCKSERKRDFRQNDKLLGFKNPLKLINGQMVEITLVFAESVTSLALEDVHQMAITAKDGWIIENDKTWAFTRKTTVSFVQGESERKKYRVNGILDCIGMDHLKNLVITVIGEEGLTFNIASSL